jgi:hypothetical protein
MTDNDELFGDTVYETGDDDAEYLDGAETLTGDGDDLDEALDTSYSPPDHRPGATRYGTTVSEQREGESLDQRLAEEEPDVTADTLGDDDRGPQTRAGRLVAPDEGAHPDEEKDLIAFDAGKAGSAASAEEAAVHVIGEDDESLDVLESDEVDRLED